LSHTYATPGIKTVTIEGIFGYFAPNCYNGAEYNKLIDIVDWGSTVWQNLNFESCTYIDDFSASGQPDLRSITNLSYMFYGATSFNGNINNWDVSQVVDMEEMFRGAAAFNSPLDQWDVSRVTNMEQMFRGASSFNQPLNNWDVSRVTNMEEMFRGASSFNQPLNNWDVSLVEDMSAMFTQATSFNQDISSWDISNTFFDWIGFDGTALSIPNYTKILLAWSQLPITQNNSFGEIGPSGNLTPYCSNAQAARDVLENTYGWGDWTDGGPVSCKTATYLTSAGGVLIGDTLQYIVDGTGGTAVTVVPTDGYRFVSWSDGSIDNPRTDSNLTADISVTAILESVDAGSGSNSTAIGVRAERLAEMIANTPVFASITTFVTSVREFLDYLITHEDELETLPAEERNRIIIALRDIITFLLKFVPAGD
jgi:surface protein